MFQRNLWDITDNQKAFVAMENSHSFSEKFHMGASAGAPPAPWLFLPFSLSLFPLLQMFGGRGVTRGAEDGGERGGGPREQMLLEQHQESKP